MSQPIRVLLVDDSPLALAVLKKLLSESADIEVAGTAMHGREALEMIPRLNPDVVCTDLHMPVMDGLELTRKIMEKFPRPILVISTAFREQDNELVFKLLEAGAVDVYPKPRAALASSDSQAAAELIKKIRVVKGVVVFHKHVARSTLSSLASAAGTMMRKEVKAAPSSRPKLLAIGASTGGPQALDAILSPLPSDYPLPILCVQHISAGFLTGLVDWLARHCRLKVKIAEPGEKPKPGCVYFPEEGAHLLLDASGALAASHDPPYRGHRPSVNLTFRSVAKFCGKDATGVLLTGMGDDGAHGLKEIMDAGGLTIAQNEATSIVFGMPRVAIELGAVRHVLSLEEITAKLLAIAM